jgi:uncharacterized membrane protein
MKRQVRLCLGFLAALGATSAQASDIPTDDSGFTAYIQNRLQLYASVPVNVVGPLSLSAGTPANSSPLPSLKPVHDTCISQPAQCQAAADAYVQNTAHDVLQKRTASAAVPGMTTLVACNRTQRTVAVASIYLPVSSGKWRSTGWIEIDPATCRGVLATANTTFYARAEEAVRNQRHDADSMSGRDVEFMNGLVQGDAMVPNAGGDIRLCVRHSGNWDVMADNLRETCSSDASEPADFKTFHSDGRAMLVWNLAS